MDKDMKCKNCNKHKATENWIGDGGIFAYTHGMSEPWCKCCVLQAQIKHAEKIIKNYEKLKVKLYKIKCK